MVFPARFARANVRTLKKERSFEHDSGFGEKEASPVYRDHLPRIAFRWQTAMSFESKAKNLF